MKHLKKTNEIFNILRMNEMNDTDFGNEVGEWNDFLDDRLKDFIVSVKNLAKDYLETIGFKSKKDGENSYVISTRLPQENEFKSFIHKEISNGIDNYDDLVEVGKDDEHSRHIVLKFKMDDEIYLIPLIITMSCDIQRSKFGKSKVEYSIWLNTYVAQKINKKSKGISKNQNF